ncbi:unnamed protein product [Timema podura]|uniref:Uncharacterized protein n=1 Tax=Timema podura TaxID=61482 RepID=A0ABN7PJ60_TIMPD|nr:unnamed protein product [Timema podura]
MTTQSYWKFLRHWGQTLTVLLRAR